MGLGQYCSSLYPHVLTEDGRLMHVHLSNFDPSVHVRF